MSTRTLYGLVASVVLVAAACGGSPFTGSSGVSGSAGADGSGGAKAGASAGKGGSAAGGIDSGGRPVAGATGMAGGPGGEAGEPGQKCVVASDCLASSQCVKVACLADVCVEEPLPDGPFMLQVPGDCKQARCERGQEVLVVDVLDKDDKVECTQDACDADGHPTHVARVGAECGGGGLCSPEGTCETCDRNGCPAAGPCQAPYCSGNQCKLGLKQLGSICGQDTPVDARQCDEQGACVDCVDNGGCDETSACTAQRTCGAT